TLNMFGSYRFSSTVAAAVEWRIGSGAPIPGFLATTNGVLSGLSSERNQARAPAYSRIDARIAKAFRLGPGKLTLSGEVLNLVNRNNEYPVSSTLVHVVETGQYAAGLRRGFPLVPSIGVAIEF